jgi:hypothetical protein
MYCVFGRLAVRPRRSANAGSYEIFSESLRDVHHQNVEGDTSIGNNLSRVVNALPLGGSRAGGLAAQESATYNTQVLSREKACSASHGNAQISAIRLRLRRRGQASSSSA